MSGIREIDVLLALAFVLVGPIGLSMFRWADPQAERLRRLAQRASPFAGAAAALALFVESGQFDGVLGAAWLAVCVVVAISAAAELVRTRPGGLEPYLPILACAYLAAGAVWFVLYQSGIRPMDLPAERVELTAVHFNYAGFAGLVLAFHASRWLRALPGKWNRLAAFSGLGVAISMVLVTAGVGGSPLMEVEGSVIMALCLVAIAAGTTLIAFRLPFTARILLLVSSASVWVSMVLAVQYAFGQYAVSGAVSVRDMARTHGLLSLVFALCGLLGWKVAAGRATLAPRPPVAAEDPAAQTGERGPLGAPDQT